MKSQEKQSEGYYIQVHRWGRITILMTMLCLLSMGLYLSFIKGYHPGWGPIAGAFFAIAAMVGHVWINIADYVTYVLVMGPAATYLSAVVGDIKNMRLPCAMAAVGDVDAGCAQGKRDILAACGVLVSVLLNLILSVVLVFTGTFILKWFPQELNQALNAIIPALFGAVFAQMAASSVRTAVISLPLCILVANLTFIPSALRTLAAILLIIAVSVLTEKRLEKNPDPKQ